MASVSFLSVLCKLELALKIAFTFLHFFALVIYYGFQGYISESSLTIYVALALECTHDFQQFYWPSTYVRTYI